MSHIWLWSRVTNLWVRQELHQMFWSNRRNCVEFALGDECKHSKFGGKITGLQLVTVNFNILDLGCLE